MIIVGSLVLIILLLLGYILVSPISIYFGFTFGDGFSGFAAVKLFPFEHTFLRDTTPKAVRTKGVEIEHKKSRLEKGRNALNSAVEIFHIAVNELELLQNITINLLKLVRGILRSPDHYYLKISMAGGLGPPDFTGQLYGTILSVQPVLGSSFSLTYRPDYLAEEMSGQVVAGTVVRAYRLVSELLIFAWRLPKLRTLRLYQQLKKGG
ncbi:MAG: hypothetical protein ACW97O_14715 [Candidatus Thorarchaeota archaeon]|jgi:hypothetical protein